MYEITTHIYVYFLNNVFNLGDLCSPIILLLLVSTKFTRRIFKAADCEASDHASQPCRIYRFVMKYIRAHNCYLFMYTKGSY
jgi:hypothetical protein